MTTWDLIIALFYHVDEQLHDIPNVEAAQLRVSDELFHGAHRSDDGS